VVTWEEFPQTPKSARYISGALTETFGECQQRYHWLLEIDWPKIHDHPVKNFETCNFILAFLSVKLELQVSSQPNSTPQFWWSTWRNSGFHQICRSTWIKWARPNGSRSLRQWHVFISRGSDAEVKTRKRLGVSDVFWSFGTTWKTCWIQLNIMDPGCPRWQGSGLNSNFKGWWVGSKDQVVGRMDTSLETERNWQNLPALVWPLKNQDFPSNLNIF